VEFDLRIYIATHKQFVSPKEDYFQPIHVGKSLQEDLGFIGDDTGDSISDKNPFYCELTALYWAWKNDNSDFLGLCHYRRYFDIDNITDRINDIRFITQSEFNKEKFPKQKIAKYLSKYDVILAKPKVYELSIEQIYGYCHSIIDFEILTETLDEIYPEYSKSWREIAYKSNKLSHYNMFIGRKDIINNYCEWLFKLLFEVEGRVKISPYSYDKRVFGFMSERLMQLYFTHNDFNIKFLPIIYVKDESFKNKTPNKIYKFLSDKYKNLLFFFLNYFKKF
jgi:hypothetical protein